MSGLIKSIGKTFKSVAKFAKKFAVPALMLGAVALTGGAALGLALPSLGGIATSLGLGSLAPVLSAAGTGSLVGAGGALLTGGNIVKGATAGFVTGGAMGGISTALSGGFSSAARAAAGTTAGNVGNAVNSAANTVAGAGAPAAATSAASGSAGGLAQAVPRAASGLVQAAAPTASGGGGFLGAMFRDNPIVAGQMLAGVGEGLLAGQASKSERKAMERNYSGMDGLMTAEEVAYDGERPNAGDHFNERIRGAQRFAYNPNRGRIAPMTA